MLKVIINPSLNEMSKFKKVYGHKFKDNTTNLILKYKKEHPNNCYIHFTNLNKLGVNPKQQYKTPFGISCYPLWLYNDREISELSFPFMAEAKNIFLFSVKKEYLNKVEHIIINPETKFKNTTIQQIDNFFKDVEANYQETPDFDPLKKGLESAYRLDIVSKFWNVSRLAVDENIIKWSQLISKQLNCIGVVDEGSGTIHKNEPLQALFFSAVYFEDIKSFHNPKNIAAKPTKPNKKIITSQELISFNKGLKKAILDDLPKIELGFEHVLNYKLKEKINLLANADSSVITINPIFQTYADDTSVFRPIFNIYFDSSHGPLKTNYYLDLVLPNNLSNLSRKLITKRFNDLIKNKDAIKAKLTEFINAVQAFIAQDVKDLKAERIKHKYKKKVGWKALPDDWHKY